MQHIKRKDRKAAVSIKRSIRFLSISRSPVFSGEKYLFCLHCSIILRRSSGTYLPESPNCGLLLSSEAHRITISASSCDITVEINNLSHICMEAILKRCLCISSVIYSCCVLSHYIVVLCCYVCVHHNLYPLFRNDLSVVQVLRCFQLFSGLYRSFQVFRDLFRSFQIFPGFLISLFPCFLLLCFFLAAIVKYRIFCYTSHQKE